MNHPLFYHAELDGAKRAHNKRKRAKNDAFFLESVRILTFVAIKSKFFSMNPEDSHVCLRALEQSSDILTCESSGFGRLFGAFFYKRVNPMGS